MAKLSAHGRYILIGLIKHPPDSDNQRNITATMRLMSDNKILFKHTWTCATGVCAGRKFDTGWKTYGKLGNQATIYPNSHAQDQSPCNSSPYLYRNVYCK